jgi:hypothetical protein
VLSSLAFKFNLRRYTKATAVHHESNPSAAAADEAFAKQKKHLQNRGITLATECPPDQLNTPYLLNLEEDPFRSRRQLCILVGRCRVTQ